MTAMTPAEAVFFAAAALPAAGRPAYLAHACAGNDDLRRQVERMLAARSEVVDFLEPSPPVATADGGATGTFAAKVDTAEPTADFPGRDEHVGAILGGKYKLIEEIGAGGMGRVYMAQQTAPVKRLVAVKVIKAGMDSKAVLARFEAERQALALMDHPNIARVLDAGTTDSGRPYFVMGLVKGVPITEFCDERKLTPKQRLELFVPVCNAIQHAHQKGIIHRDIKPTNVLVALSDDRPVPKVIDFGLAKAAGHTLTDKTLVTGFGAVVGTPEYMSPEQATLNNEDIDTQSDVYSLGVLLYELLAGSTPVDRNQLGTVSLLEVLRIVREVEPPPPSTRLSDSDTLPAVAANRGTEPGRLLKLLKGELDWVVLKALEKDRARRYDTANGLARDIQRHLADDVVEARPPSRVYRLRKFVRRNKVQVLAAVAVTVAMAAGSVVSAYFAFQANARAEDADHHASQARLAEAAEKKAREEALTLAAKEAEAKEQTRQQLRRTEWAVYAGKLQLAQAALAENRVKEALRHLDDCPWEMRGWEHRHLRWRSDGCKQTLKRHTGVVSGVAFSPDGKRILTGSWDHTAKVWDAATGTELLALAGHTAPVTSVAFSPDGARILTGSHDHTARVWDAGIGTELLALRGHSGLVTSVAFRPDGKRIVTGCHDHVARVWDAEKGNELVALKGHALNVNCVAFSPDGTRIVTGSHDHTAKVWDAGTGMEQQTLKGYTLPVSSACFSPDGKRILTGGYDGLLKVWDTAAGTELASRLGHATRVTGVAFSPDGLRLLCGSHDHTAKVWDAEKGNVLLSLQGHMARVSSVAFSPGGTRIVTGCYDGTVKVWDADTSTGPLALRGHTAEVSSVAFSPDGRRVLTGGYDNSARVWDVGTGTELLAPLRHAARVRSVSFSADGRKLVTGSYDGTLTVRDADTGTELLAFKGHERRVSTVAFSPDGKRLFTCGYDGTATGWDAEKGTQVLSLQGHTAQVTSISFRPDGKRILTSGYDGTAKVWDAEKGTVVQTLTGHAAQVSSASFSPDGTRIVTGCFDGTAKVWEAGSGAELLSLKGHTASVTSASFSPDGTRIVTGSDDHTARVWDAGTGTELLALQGHTAQVSSVCFSTDGRRLLTGSWDDTAKVWDSVKGTELFAPQGHTAQVSHLSFSPDGRRLLTGGGDGTLKVWDAVSAAELLTLKGHTGRANGVAFSPDGKRAFAWCSDDKVYAWSVEDGRPVAADNAPRRPTSDPDRSPDGRLSARAEGTTVAIVDLLKRSADALPWPLPAAAARKAYHADQADRATQERQWFAVAFHLGRLLTDDPGNADLKKRREEAIQKHAGR